jgi:uroporphyrinogen decarboxylase
MTHRERVLNCLRYEVYDRLPVVHFGFWGETLQKWQQEGHLTAREATTWGDGNPADVAISRKLGFDANYYSTFAPNGGLLPGFVPAVIERLPDGSRKEVNGDGVIVLVNDAAGSIPAEVEHLLVDRQSWEQHYLPRLQYAPERLAQASVNMGERAAPFAQGGLEYLKHTAGRENPIGLHCGSLFGMLRNWIGVTGSAYIYADDEPLFTEMIDTVANLAFRLVQDTLATGAQFDFAHFWEDICFKNGPLIAPTVFEEKVGPHYKRLTELLLRYGIDIVSVDCDGMIDSLIPTWFNNGVNTMFPIEVGTWNANIAPWRAKFGRPLRGVGGMNKVVFAHDFAAIDREIERLKPLVDLGGFIPCPDHRLAPDAKWDCVRYYCDRMHQCFD